MTNDSEQPRCETSFNGTQRWWLRGKLHRTDGPATIWFDGEQEWRVHGKRHRTDGPARILFNNELQWWINDRHLTLEINSWMKGKGVTWPWDEETQTEFALTWT